MGDTSESNEQRIERRDALRVELSEMRQDLRDHVAEEMPLIRIVSELGTADQVRERRAFVESWIKREEARTRLRTAIIEKGLLVAVLAVIAFVVQAVWHELVLAVKLMTGRQ